MNKIYLVECCQCGKKYEVAKSYYPERLKKKAKCRSCVSKGENNSNYGNFKLLGLRDKIEVSCNECKRSFSITYERAMLSKNMYGYTFACLVLEKEIETRFLAESSQKKNERSLAN